MKKTGSFAVLVSVILCAVGPSVPTVSASASEFMAIPVRDDGSGVLTLEDGQKWYKVKGFEDNADYILTVRNGAGEQLMISATDGEYNQYVWNYSRTYMTPSTDPMVVSLSTGRFVFTCINGELQPDYAYREGDRIWSHEDSVLQYSADGELLYLKYDAGSNPPFTMTADKTDASEVILYSRSTTLARCITQQPAAESYVIEGSGYPAPEFTVGLSDVITDSVRWYVDGDEQPCKDLNFAADTLTGRPAGTHSVSCTVEAHDSDGVHYCEESAAATFVIAKGVLPDSVMTFSDIHEEYHLIRSAIGRIIEETEGYIPSLVICTGDFVNGPTAETKRELNRYFPKIVSAIGGLDAVFVAGNHDSAEAASRMSVSAALGAGANLPAAGGLIFDGESQAVLEHGKSSRFSKGVRTYGINFGAAEKGTEHDPFYTYEDVIGDLEQFLQAEAEQYHGEMIVISAHSGLHLIGRQPQSVNYYDSPLMEWTGYNHYNLDMSYTLAETINRYAEQYDMDILYLFGHNHSRGEKELFLAEGDQLISPECYADKRFSSLTLHFTYANAGYLSSSIGAADSKFSFIYKDGERISYDLLRAGGGIVHHADIKAKQPYMEPIPAETTQASETTTEAETTTADSTAQETASGTNAAAPAAGDSGVTVKAAVIASAVLMLSKKRRRSSTEK